MDCFLIGVIELEIYALFRNGTYFCAAIMQEPEKADGQYDEVGDERWLSATANLEDACDCHEEWILLSEADFEKYRAGAQGSEIIDLPSGARIYHKNKFITMLKAVDKENQSKVTYSEDGKKAYFNGEVYFRNDSRGNSGYYARTELLHIAVWEYYNGKLPSGYVVHHTGKDENSNFDKSKNDIEYLQMMSKSEHVRLHKLRQSAFENVCIYCGKVYLTRSKRSKYCSRRCQWQNCGKPHRKAHGRRKINVVKALATDAIKNVAVDGNTVKFYTVKTPAEGATPAYTVDFPAEMILDAAKTGFVADFAFNAATYPGATDPNLDGKAVLVLAIKTTDKGVDTTSYSFISVDYLVNTYTAGDNSITINGYTVAVKISAAANNAIELKADGLHVDISGKADRDTDAVEGNAAKFGTDGSVIDAGVAFTAILTTSDIAPDADVTEVLSSYFTLDS